MIARPVDRICDRAYQSLFCFASAASRRDLGLRAFERGPLFAGFSPRIDAPALNRVLGLGRAPDSLDLLVHAMEWLRRSEVRRALLPVLAGPTGARAGAWLLDRGLSLWGTQARFTVRLDLVSDPGLPAPARPFTVEPIPPAGRPAHAELLSSLHGLPPAASRFLAEMGPAAGWSHFGAYVGGRLSGAASLYVEGGAGALTFGSVPEHWRAAGMHEALLGVRIRVAREAGCVEASAEFPEAVGGGSIPLAELAAWGFDRVSQETAYLYRSA